ncbi:GYF domain-containing protein [Thiocystis violacea]|uniref:GYF domain-containing protein n=1 Tax=Thiocystis violacea TaxID=13725 RepID=UPI001908A0EA|nr:zinc-ribbon domain-containing protein [Thiocystis violacea]MBK1720279.1 hypothetical protein [Thiocystis violacea]
MRPSSSSSSPDPLPPGTTFILAGQQGARMAALGQALQRVCTGEAPAANHAGALGNGVTALIALAGTPPVQDIPIDGTWHGALQSLPGGVRLLMVEDADGGQSFTLRCNDQRVAFEGEWEMRSPQAAAGRFYLARSQGGWKLRLVDGERELAVELAGVDGLTWTDPPDQLRLFAQGGTAIGRVVQELERIAPSTGSSASAPPPPPAAPPADRRSTRWYYLSGIERKGPVDDETMHALGQRGAITAQTLVWNETLADWMSAERAGLAIPVVERPAVTPPPPGEPPLTSDAGRHCASCGATNSREAKFCRQCGTPLSPERLCPACRQPVAATARFCRHCGGSLA